MTAVARWDDREPRVWAQALRACRLDSYVNRSNSTLRNLCVLCASAVYMRLRFLSPQRHRGRRDYAERFQGTTRTGSWPTPGTTPWTRLRRKLFPADVGTSMMSLGASARSSELFFSIAARSTMISFLVVVPGSWRRMRI